MLAIIKTLLLAMLLAESAAYAGKICNRTSDTIKVGGTIRLASPQAYTTKLKFQGWTYLERDECQEDDFYEFYAESVDGKLKWAGNYDSTCVNENGNYSVVKVYGYEKIVCPGNLTSKGSRETSIWNETYVRFSDLSSGSSEGKLEKEVKVTTQRVKKYLRDVGLEFEDTKRLVDPYLGLDIRDINLSDLPADLPAWFKEFLTLLKGEASKLDGLLADVESKQGVVDEELRKEVQNVLESEGIDANSFEIGNLAEVPLADYDEIIDVDEDLARDELRVRATNYIELFESLYTSRDRLGFLSQVYVWLEETKVLEPTFIASDASDPGIYAEFVSTNKQIETIVFSYLDEDLYFKDLNLPTSTKNAIERLSKVDAYRYTRLKNAVNSLPSVSNPLRERALAAIEPTVDAFIASKGSTGELAFTKVMDDVIGVLISLEDVVTCLGANMFAGIGVSWVEITTGKDFCTGEELNGWDYSLSFAGFMADAAEFTRVPVLVAGGVATEAALALKKLYSVMEPALRKARLSIQNIRDTFSILLDSFQYLMKDGFSNIFKNFKILVESATDLKNRLGVDINVSNFAKLKRSPVSDSTVILDNNVASAWTRSKKGDVLSQAGDRNSINKLNEMGTTDLRITDVSAGKELNDLSVLGNGFEITVKRDSTEYSQVLSKLEEVNLGGSKGHADRVLTADLFFAKGGSPSFMTADKNVFNKLYTVSGGNIQQLGKSVPEAFPNGFPVTLNGKTINVIPISGK